MLGASRTSLAELRDQLTRGLTDADEPELRRVAGELFALVHLFAAELRLRRAVTDASWPAERRAALMAGLLQGKVSPRTEQVVEGVARSTWSRPGDVVDALDALAAQALFTQAQRDEQLEDVEDELFRFARILDREPALRAALTDLGLPAERRVGVLDQLLSGKVRPATETLVREAVLYPRSRTIDRALEDYAALAAARREAFVARVRTAVPLTDAEQERLAAALARQLGQRVHLNVEVDRNVVGGLSVLIGDQLFDGTISHRIADARRLMAGR